MSDCLFCKIAQGEIKSDFVFKSEEIVAFRDINPKAPVHILIIPKKHISKISDISENEQQLVGKMIGIANKIAIKEKIDKDGYRLVFNCGQNGGQEVYHIHLHLLGGRKMNWPPG